MSFNVRGEQTAPNSFTYVTGLGPAEIVAVNPTKKELLDLTGRDLPETFFDYSTRENSFLEITERPVVFWLKNEKYDIYVPMRFNVSDQPFEIKGAEKSFKGFINSVGSYTLAESKDALDANPKMQWFTKYPYRQAYVGENSLYTFMQKTVRYNNRSEDAAWLDDMEKNGCTIPEIYKGNIDGLREFVKHTKKEKNYVAVLYSVRARELEDGTVKYYQEVVDDPKTFYWCLDGNVTVRSTNSLQDYVNDQQARGRDVSKNHYTINLQPFNKTEVDKDAPSNVAEPEEQEEVKSDLPF